MTLLLIIAAVWLLLLVCVWAVFRSAGKADDEIERMYREQRFPFEEPRGGQR